MATGLLKTGLVTQLRTTKSVAGSSNVTLSSAEAQSGVLEFTGALTGNIQVIVPSALMIAGTVWEVCNNTSGAFTLTYIGATGTGVPVTQGTRSRILFDGTNMARLAPESIVQTAQVSDAIQDAIMGAPTITAGAESANTITVTVQLKDLAGNNLASVGRFRWWLSDAQNQGETAAAPSGGVSVTSGYVLKEVTLNKQYDLLTLSTGALSINVVEAAAKSFWVHAEHDGRVASLQITFV